MKPDIAKKWTEALRSGEYKQGCGQLMNDSGHCCLGVLTDIAAKEDIIGAQAALNSGRPYLPDSVMRWAGMSDKCGALENGKTLVGYNDGGTPFAEIADIIEANVEAL